MQLGNSKFQGQSDRRYQHRSKWEGDGGDRPRSYSLTTHNEFIPQRRGERYNP